MFYIAGALVIFSLVLLIFTSRTMEDKLLKGFWRADPDFCKIAQLEMFVLYLGDNSNYLGHTRNGYLLSANEHGIILNNPITASFSTTFNLLPGFATCKKYNLSIDWQENEPNNNAFPTDVQVAYYPKHGKLVMYDDDTVYAILWRDSQMSAMDTDENLLPSELKSEHPDNNAGGESIGDDGVDI